MSTDGQTPECPHVTASSGDTPFELQFTFVSVVYIKLYIVSIHCHMYEYLKNIHM